MSGSWKHFFQFSSSERRGLSVLVLLCLLSAANARFIPSYISQRQINRFEKENETLLAELRAKESSVEMVTGNSGTFDSISEKDTDTAGLSYSGVIRNTGRPVTPSGPDVRELNINNSSAYQLLGSGLVSKSMAFRIVRYRERLGGFVSLDQIGEVYEMPDSVYLKIKEEAVLGDVELRPIHVNTASAEVLMQHPYIHKGLANQIVNYREKVRLYAGKEDLLKLYFMDEKLLVKLSPYLAYNLE